MLNFIDKIHINLLNVLFPKLCLGCEKPLILNEKAICTVCLHYLPLTLHYKLEVTEITRVFYGILPIEKGLSLLYFNKKGITQKLIHNLKYKKQQEVGSFLGNYFANDLKKYQTFETVDYIIPVPLHKKRLHQRGYNQVTTFCNAISEKLNIEVLDSVLVKTKNIQSQTIKNKLNRLKNSKEVFEIKNFHHLKNKHFLLIDDVFTTGATMEACAREILKIENAKVSILTIAYSDS